MKRARLRAATAAATAALVAVGVAVAVAPFASPASVAEATFGGASAAPMARLAPAGSRPGAPVFKDRPLAGTGPSYGPDRFGGEVVVLAFWSSWCSPCRSELRQLETVWRARPAGAQVLGVDVNDSSSPASAVLRRAGATFPNVADPASTAATAYRIAGTPTIVILDRRGRVAATAIGPTPAATVLRLVRLLDSPG